VVKLVTSLLSNAKHYQKGFKLDPPGSNSGYESLCVLQHAAGGIWVY